MTTTPEDAECTRSAQLESIAVVRAGLDNDAAAMAAVIAASEHQDLLLSCLAGLAISAFGALPPAVADRLLRALAELAVTHDAS